MIESRGCPRFKATEGEAVPPLAGPRTLGNEGDGYHRLSRRVNKTDLKLQNSYLNVSIDIKDCSNYKIIQ